MCRRERERTGENDENDVESDDENESGEGSDDVDGDEDDDGPTERNPWGRDGDTLRGGVAAFERLIENMTSSGRYCCFSEACAAPDEDSFNALHHCAFQGYHEILEVIVAKAGPSLAKLLSVPVLTGEAPLHLAVQYKREKCIDILLKAGADIRLKERKYGMTVMDFVTRPESCAATYLIAPDKDYQSRMQKKFQSANMFRIGGLTSEAGKHMNGQTCEKMSVDESSGRYIVRLNPSDPKPAWKKLKSENLTSLLDLPESSSGYPATAE